MIYHYVRANKNKNNKHTIKYDSIPLCQSEIGAIEPLITTGTPSERN